MKVYLPLLRSPPPLSLLFPLSPVSLLPLSSGWMKLLFEFWFFGPGWAKLLQKWWFSWLARIELLS